MSWRRLWVIRLMTSPSQKTGIEMPISPRTISTGRRTCPRMTAATAPIAMADHDPDDGRAEHERERDRRRVGDLRDDLRAAIDERGQVAGDEELLHHHRVLDGQRPVEAEVVAHRASVSGAALRPAMRAAGSTPGVAKKIRNTSTLMPNITKSIATQPADDEGDHAASPTRSLARGSSASRTPSPRTLRQSTVSTMAMPGASATHGPGVEQRPGRPDDRAPAGVGRLHADREERQRRFGEHVDARSSAGRTRSAS